MALARVASTSSAVALGFSWLLHHDEHLRRCMNDVLAIDLPGWTAIDGDTPIAKAVAGRGTDIPTLPSSVALWRLLPHAVSREAPLPMRFAVSF
jgi:hypothetical protein